jgi:hypothetical protein
VAASFIGGGNLSARRKPLTYRKSLDNDITEMLFKVVLNTITLTLTHKKKAMMTLQY